MPRKRRKIHTSPWASSLSRDSDELTLDTTGEERFKVFEICTRMRKYTAALLTAGAALSTLMLMLQFFMDVQMLFASPPGFFVIIAIGSIGIINLICGLLLLATE